MSDHWKDLADKLGTPSFDVIPKKSRTSRPTQIAADPESAPVSSAMEAPSDLVPAAEPVVPAPQKKRSSSWDALSRLFGMGSTSSEEVAESVPPAAASISTPAETRPEPSSRFSRDRRPAERSAPEEPVRLESPKVDPADEIGWVSPKSQKATKLDSSSSDQSSREPMDTRSREVSPSARGNPEVRRGSNEKRETGRRDHSKSERPDGRSKGAPQPRPREDMKTESENRPSKRRTPSFWDSAVDVDSEHDEVEDKILDLPVAESVDEKDFEATDTDNGDPPARRGRRRRPRRGRRDGESSEVERSVSPRSDEPRRRPESTRSEGGRTESPRSDSSRGDSSRGDSPRAEASRGEASRSEFGRGEPRRDHSRREKAPSAEEGDATIRNVDSEDSEGESGSRSGARRRSRGRRGRGGERVPGERSSTGSGERSERELDRSRDDVRSDDIVEVDSEVDFPSKAFEDEAPVESRGRGRDRSRGRSRTKPPRDESIERDPLDDEETSDILDDEDGEPQARHRKIPTWAEAIGILVELNQENHKKASSQFGGHRRRGGGGHSNDSNRGGGNRGHHGPRGGSR